MKDQVRVRRKQFAAGFIVVLAAIQLIPVTKTNPAVEATRTLWATNPPPPEVSAILLRSCQDCHTNRTTWPSYSHVAPVSWLVASDVIGGRRHLNLDEWSAYSTGKKQSP